MQAPNARSIGTPLRRGSDLDKALENVRNHPNYYKPKEYEMDIEGQVNSLIIYVDSDLWPEIGPGDALPDQSSPQVGPKEFITFDEYK